MKQNLFASFLLAASPLGFALACGASEPGGSGSVDSLAGGTGSASATTGGAASGGSSATGSSATGGDPGSGGGSANGSGGAGGAASSAGPVGSGGGGTGGAGGTADSEGCPLTLEGFATVSGEGQDGTHGGRDGETVTVTNQADLERYAGASEPHVIRVQGKITISPKGKEISVASDKTIVGIGATAEISQGGFFLGSGVHNVILRNLTIGDTFVEGDWEGKTQDFDGIQMDTAHHVWIDHCHLHHIGDGMIDSRKDTSYLTVSWSVLSDHNKAFGIGWTENVTAQMTIHHNWFRDLNQRNPSTDNVLRAHLYNNWLQRIDSYGNYARGGTNMVLENSVFDTVNRPHYFDDGTLVAAGNIYRSTSGDKESSGSTYSFFDPSDFYEYSLDPADQVEALLTRCAGPRPELGL
ncbi:hypothetical protein BE17_36825 [Sorangium cellulosum]|uniref:Pectate lyase domain-containing protein n=1 Tax=Sorangium cellulosum TaxID=56 RepID=A0A150RDL9_SORCE|nr:hypothetical protein BE17_36825 [Sorangium cellulosum]